jgi:hypothetical protein
MSTAEIKTGDWFIAPWPLTPRSKSHTAIFKVHAVLGESLFTYEGRKRVEIETRRLVGCSLRRGDKRMIYRP